MSTLSAIQTYLNIVGNPATRARNATAGSQTSATTSPAASTQVSISSAAREAAANDASAHIGLKLPDYISQWFNKDFPPDIVDEAKARLADVKVNGALGAEGPLNLPLLPENQKLADGFRQEMKRIHDAGFENATPAESARYNLLMNLSMRLRLTGWEKPMTEADVQREFDISAAMAKLSVHDPLPRPATPSDKEIEQNVAAMRSDEIPAAWRRRWEKAGLTMPEEVTVSRERSMWLDVAQAAGIGDDEFMTTLREMGASMKGSALTRAIEGFISDRYAALTEAQKATA